MWGGNVHWALCGPSSATHSLAVGPRTCSQSMWLALNKCCFLPLVLSSHHSFLSSKRRRLNSVISKVLLALLIRALWNKQTNKNRSAKRYWIHQYIHTAASATSDFCSAPCFFFSSACRESCTRLERGMRRTEHWGGSRQRTGVRSLEAGVRLGAVPTHQSWLLIVLCGCGYRGIQSHSPTFTEGCMTTARLSTTDFYTRQMVAGTSRL